MLAVVLIVDDGLDGGQAAAEHRLARLAMGFSAMGMGTPGDIGARQIGLVLPQALVDRAWRPAP